jgi:hypothetical protein
MPSYRTVKNPGVLKGTVIEADDRGLTGSVDPAIGLGTEPDRPDAQLDIRYRDSNVSPEDCRASWKAAQ